MYNYKKYACGPAVHSNVSREQQQTQGFLAFWPVYDAATLLALSACACCCVQDAAQVPSGQEEHQEACNSLCSA